MKWQWKLGTFAGIDVFVQATFLLIVGWYGFTYWQETRTLFGALEGVTFILLLFLAVTLHEYGHALTARKFGVQTRDISFIRLAAWRVWNVCPKNQSRNCG